MKKTKKKVSPKKLSPAARKKNPQDATLRNIRALKKKIEALEKRVDNLERVHGVI